MRYFLPQTAPWRPVIAMISFGLTGLALADDVSESDNLLCYGWSAAQCDHDGICEVTEAWRVNVPDFIQLDLQAGVATTTGPDEDQRETEIESMEREDGLIILLGKQDGRAYSWVITEATGEGTLTVAAVDVGLTLFTVCTPTEQF